MSKDLRLTEKKKTHIEKWKKGKRAAFNVIGIKSIRVGSAPPESTTESQKTLRDELGEEQETTA